MLAQVSKRELPFREFVIILSLMMSLTALSIDAMLPALPAIGSELGVHNTNDRQLVISILFLGIAFGQLFFGPLSDSVGRKPAMYAGFTIYIAGTLLSALAGTFPLMIFGRLLQGIGVSAPRAITLALVRDRHEGHTMARVMSFIMTIFILVPMLAPALGQAIIFLAGWRAIFLSFIAMALLSVTWFALRMPETLPPERRVPFSPGRITRGIHGIITNRTALGYTVSAGLVGGAFLGYLNSAQQILQEQYALGDLFSVVFATIALSIGLASLANTHLVMRFGTRLLINRALSIIVLLAAVAIAIALPAGGHPPLWFLLAYLMISFFGVGILFGNQNAVAMEPLGHLAGTGAAVVGALSTLIQMPLGTVIGHGYNGTVLPLIIGLGVLAALALLVTRWANAA